MRLGVFGGTFNPIHFGHLRTAEEIMEKGRLEKVIFMPSGSPPLKTRELAGAEHRYAMTCLATGTNSHFLVSDMEVRQRETSFTVNTIKRLNTLYPGDELSFILGIDAFLDIPNWWQPDELTSLTDFIVVSRPGYDASDIRKSPFLKNRRAKIKIAKDGAATLNQYASLGLKSGRNVTLIPVTSIGISSTVIRGLLREGKSVRYLLPESVEDYILSRKLYR